MGLERLLEETPEAYYWAGFIMADGYINHKTWNFKITLSLKDKSHLEKLSQFIDVKIIDGKSNLNGDNFYNVTINKCNKNDISKIIEKFDYRDKKTYNPPNIHIERDDLFLSFFIGYFDGDGTIGNGNNQIRILCNDAWMDLLDKWFLRCWNLAGCKINNNIVKVPKSKMVTIRKSNLCSIGTKNSQFVWFLKNKAIEMGIPILKRKWDKLVVRQFTYQDNGKERILDLIKRGLSNEEIKNITGCGNYLYCVKNKYLKRD